MTEAAVQQQNLASAEKLSRFVALVFFRQNPVEQTIYLSEPMLKSEALEMARTAYAEINEHLVKIGFTGWRRINGWHLSMPDIVAIGFGTEDLE